MSELYQMKPVLTEDGGFYYPVAEKERFFYSKYPDTGRIFTNIVEWQADYEAGYARAVAEVYLDTMLVSRAEAVVFARSCMGKPHEGMFADTAATKAVGKALSQFGIGIDDTENRIPSGPIMHPVVPITPDATPVVVAPIPTPVQSSMVTPVQKAAVPSATKSERWDSKANPISAVPSPASVEDATPKKPSSASESRPVAPVVSDNAAQQVSPVVAEEASTGLSGRSAKALAALWENYFKDNAVDSPEALLKQLQTVERMSDEECAQTVYPFGGDFKNSPLPALMSSDGGKKCLCWATGIGEKAYRGKQTHIIRASRSIILKVLGL